MNSKGLILSFGASLMASACTWPIDVQSIRPGSNLSGLKDSDLGDSHRAAPIDVVISSKDARLITLFGNNSVHLLIHRCNAPDDYYPAFAFYDGQLFDEDVVTKAADTERVIALTFFLPEEVQKRGTYDCAALDVRGMVSPVFFKSRPQHLPNGLRFQAPAAHQ